MNIKGIASVAIIGAGVIIVKAAPFALGYIGGYTAVHAIRQAEAFSSIKPETLHQSLAVGAAEVRKTLPQKIDELTTMIDAQAVGNQTVYTYDTTIDGLLDEITLKEMQAGTEKSVCAIAVLRAGIKAGATFRYEYRHDGKPIGAFDVASCSAPA